jgi:mannose-6-phosphate isomerase-like protein (cupin superfamily)
MGILSKFLSGWLSTAAPCPREHSARSPARPAGWLARSGPSGVQCQSFETTAPAITPMPMFTTLALPATPTVTAPDGSDVRVLVGLGRGAWRISSWRGRCSAAVRHRTVEKLWYVVSGEAEMWRSQDGREEVATLRPGTSLSIPLGTSFQFRATGSTPFAAVRRHHAPVAGHGRGRVRGRTLAGRLTASVHPGMKWPIPPAPPSAPLRPRPPPAL